MPPLGSDCNGQSPSDNANTSPFAIATGSGTDMSLEFHAGMRTGLLSCTSTLKAMTLPLAVGPYWIANFASGAGGPHAGAYSQRVPEESCHVDSAPQNPRAGKFTS